MSRVKVNLLLWLSTFIGNPLLKVVKDGKDPVFVSSVGVFRRQPPLSRGSRIPIVTDKGKRFRDPGPTLEDVFFLLSGQRVGGRGGGR